MNKLILIGNLTADPELRTTQNGVSVCTFTIAVNRRNNKEQTDFFRINAWRGLGETCAKYLAKGRKCSVIGELQAKTFQTNDGKTLMSLDVQADEVEFLTPAEKKEKPKEQDDGFTDINADELPF